MLNGTLLIQPHRINKTSHIQYHKYINTITLIKKDRTVFNEKDCITVKNDVVTFTFVGNGFIKYQVRNMVGLLIQIGLGKKDKNCIEKIFNNKDRSQGFRTAHPEGLYLVSVKY